MSFTNVARTEVCASMVHCNQKFNEGVAHHPSEAVRRQTSKARGFWTRDATPELGALPPAPGQLARGYARGLSTKTSRKRGAACVGGMTMTYEAATFCGRASCGNRAANHTHDPPPQCFRNVAAPFLDLRLLEKGALAGAELHQSVPWSRGTQATSGVPSLAAGRSMWEVDARTETERPAGALLYEQYSPPPYWLERAPNDPRTRKSVPAASCVAAIPRRSFNDCPASQLKWSDPWKGDPRDTPNWSLLQRPRPANTQKFLRLS